MSKLLVASLLAVATLATGCGCGAFTGQSDRVYNRGNDSLILCENDGFVANLASGVVEGKFTYNTDGSMTATQGGTAETYTMTIQPDATLATTNLGDGAWNEMTLDQTALDHADVQCTDLVSRAWWTAQ